MTNWQLNDLFPSPSELLNDSNGKIGNIPPKLQNSIKKLCEDIPKFNKRFKGNLTKLNPTQFAEFLQIYEQINTQIRRIASYAQLLYATQMNDPKISKFQADINEIIQEFDQQLIFVELEINECKPEIAQSPETENYHEFLRNIAKFKPHQLDEATESLLSELSLSASDAMIRLYDETLAKLRFPIGDKEYNQSEILNFFHDADGDNRFKAAKSLGMVLGNHEYLFAIILNAITKEGHILDKKRQFANPMASQHLQNNVSDEIVENLEQAVQESYERISHRYYALKAKMMKLPFLPYWDRLAPVFPQNSNKYTIEQAKIIVFNAYHEFSPEMAKIVQEFYDKEWIDWLPKDGKASGAFSHSCSVDAHPYILLNFQGNLDDIMTLAHELGHGVHQYLARKVGQLSADTPLVMAETASIFGEMLVYDYLMRDNSLTNHEKLALAVQKIEDGINTVIRQIAFYQFEQKIHFERRNGELSPEMIGKIWREVSVQSLGSSVHFDSDFDKFWCYISHFFHSPFYVYAYAFGELLTRALYQQYRDKPQGFIAKYTELLSLGGSQSPQKLLENFGCDLTKKQFWFQGLNQIEQMINQAEAKFKELYHE